MSILNPSVGDLVDRLCICALKIQHFPDAEHFRDEHYEIQTELSKRGVSLGAPKMQLLLAQLQGLHSKMWDHNESLRDAIAGKGTGDLQALHGRELFLLNGLRHALVDLINVESGGEPSQEEWAHS